jgi:hypothetical protein
MEAVSTSEKYVSTWRYKTNIDNFSCLKITSVRKQKNRGKYSESSKMKYVIKLGYFITWNVSCIGDVALSK